MKQLFPFTKWIGNYNLNWFVGDLIAGLTASRFHQAASSTAR